MEKFNKNLEQFIRNLSKISGDKTFIKKYDFVNPGDKYLKTFYKNCSKLSNDIANKDEIVFSEENTILEHINFNEIWNSDLNDENRLTIWNYLHTLYIFAYEHIKDVDIKSILKNLKNVSSDENNLDTDTKTLINIINSLTNKFSDNTVEEETGDDENMSYELPQIFNGTIGNLAKEIAQEINTDAINLEDPAALLKDLMSGNFDENNDTTGIVNLVKNITNKIQNKLSDGDIKENDLLSDAENLMKNFAGGGNKMAGMEGMGDLGNIFSSLMSNMNNMTNMQKGTMKTNMDRTLSNNQTKDRLKKRLAEKKKLLVQQEKILEDELNNLETTDLQDIDDLVNEIEGFNVPVKKEKKKKKKKKTKQLNLN
uniref:Uncharacterized protein n=1 Tax=viral metagenome TaxID=1070528 RepID=A0A6C0B5E4_9ZZZZ